MNTTELVDAWKMIPNTSDSYLCTNKGDVYGVDRTIVDKNGVKYNRKSKKIVPFKDRDGYLGVRLKVNGIDKYWKINRLVAFLFVDGWDECLEVNHIDFNKENNYYLNLEYKTKEGNTEYSRLNGRYKNNGLNLRVRSYKEPNITQQFSLSGSLLSEYPSLCNAAKAVGGRKNMISRAIVGRSKTAYGYKWSYKQLKHEY